MPVKSIFAKNYRAFSALGLRIPENGKNLSPSFNVLVGPNGSGKTTIANALRLAFRRDAENTQLEQITKEANRQGQLQLTRCSRKDF